MMTRSDNTEAIDQLFSELQREFGNLAPLIIQVLARTVGGLRLTFPDLRDLYRAERNRRICCEFTGCNFDELSIKYRLKVRWIRKILLNQP
jgi:Mor family transcriptional regulator